jgi:hypothetical protein
LGEQVDYLTYSTSSETYVVGTSHNVEFILPDNDELHPEWRNEGITFCPEVPQSSIKVINPKTWTVIDEYELEVAEHVMAVQNVNMEVSENTHERKDLIVVGTAITKGEDVPSRGCIYVFDVIDVVPDPEKPETGRKLKLVGKETVKGSVTALSGIGGQGFVIVAQGQKCMVRGLKEDGSLLPVAFMDMSCYVSVAKELKGTGMCLLGDAVKGIWFAGYSVRKQYPATHSFCKTTNFFCRRNPTRCHSSAKTSSTWRSLRPNSSPMEANCTCWSPTVIATYMCCSTTQKVRHILTPIPTSHPLRASSQTKKPPPS